MTEPRSTSGTSPRTMRRAKRLQHLPCNAQASLRGKRVPQRGTQGFAFHQLGHQIIGADVVKCTNVGMIERRDGPNLTVESFAETLGGDLDGHVAAQPGVPRLVHLPHAARAQRRENLIAAEARPARKRHRVLVRFYRNVQRQAAAFRRRTRTGGLSGRKGV